MLKYYKHSEIDIDKWDQCVLKSENGLVYAASWYLDIICPAWEAIIEEKEGEYLVLMPLLPKSKWGLKIHPAPPLAQQLGPIAKTSGADSLRETFRLLKSQYVIFSYPVRGSSYGAENIKDIECQKCRNYILNLNRPYQEIYSKYRRDRKARIKQALKNNLAVHHTDNVDHLLALFRSEIIHKIPGGVSESSVEHIRAIAKYVIQNKCGFIVEAYSGKSVVSAALFLKFKNRITYLVSATTAEGKILQANSLLLDQVIATYAQKPIILDFEGSSVPGIADFYNSFGAEVEDYFLIKYESFIYRLLISIKRAIPF